MVSFLWKWVGTERKQSNPSERDSQSKGEKGGLFEWNQQKEFEFFCIRWGENGIKGKVLGDNSEEKERVLNWGRNKERGL